MHADLLRFTADFIAPSVTARRDDQTQKGDIYINPALSRVSRAIRHAG